MKKLFLFYIVIGGLLMNGCTDFLDLPPKNQRAVNSLNDVKSVLAGYLDAFARSNTKPIIGPSPIVTEAQAMMFESYADNFDFENNMGQYINTKNIHAQEKFYANKLLFNDTETTDYIWNNYYAAIGFFNALIDQCDALEGADPEELKRVKGEMLVHRAYFIFKLQQYFAPMDKEELGIPLYLHTGREEMGMPMERKKSSEIYQVITSDLKQAMAFFQEVGANQGYSKFFNGRFIANLLAQVYWFKAESSSKQNDDYAEAQKYALIAVEGVDTYIPKTLLEFQNVQRNLNTEYPALYMQSIGFGTTAPIYGSNFAYIGYSPNDLKVSANFYNSFDAGDFRKAAYFNGTVMSSSWPDGMANGQKYVRIHLFEPEEAYLILAESYYRNGETALALTTLNKFKSFRGAVEKPGLTGTALLDEIISERRKEFFCNTDKRWLDLKRYKNVKIARKLRFFNKDYTINVEPGDHHYALPIPIVELQENPDIKPNEGWEIIVF